MTLRKNLTASPLFPRKFGILFWLNFCPKNEIVVANERSSFVEIGWHLNLALHKMFLEKVQKIFCQMLVESVKITN